MNVLVTNLIQKDESSTVSTLITLQGSESMPESSTIQNINLRVVLGRIALKLDDMEETIYTSGSLVNIPVKTKMKLSNQSNEESTVFLERILI